MHLIVEADGGSRGNPGPAGFGALVLDGATGELLAEVAEASGRATNNVAEYRGLLAGLRAAIAIDPACTIEVRMDSKLVVEQMSGRWQIRHGDMRALAAEVRGVIPGERVRYTWIPRSENARADRLANEAMDAAAGGRAWSRSATRSSATSSTGVSTASASAGPQSARAPRAVDLGPPTVLVLVRHGRTELTEQGRMSGSDGADPGLSAAGRTDAGRAAAVIAEFGRPGSAVPDAGPVRAMVASPLRRCRETAQAAASKLGLPVTPDDGWREIGFGAWDGLTYAEIIEGWPAELAAWQGSTTAAPPGGESLDAHATRVRAACARFLAAHPAETVLVVTHVTPIRCVVAEALDAGPAALWRTRIDPGSVTAIRYWTDGGVEVLTVNLTLP